MTGYSGIIFGDELLRDYGVDVRELRMNPVVRDAWTAALESGEYQQGQGALYDEVAITTVAGDRELAPRYCCLGVLCDLAARAGIIRLNENRTVYETPDRLYDLERYGGILPEAVARWAGLWTNDPFVTLVGGNRASLTNCNDTIGLTFPEIAERIRTSL